MRLGARIRRAVACGVCGWVLAASIGCGDGGGGGGGSGSVNASGVKQYDAAALPKVEFNLPPLDGGRVEVPTPDGWAPAAQRKGNLAIFFLKGRSGFPQMILKVEEGGGETTTPANVVAYSDKIQAELNQQEAEKKSRVLEAAKPMQLGGNAWVRYVLAGRLPGKELATIERQVLKTCSGGRVYTLELQVRGQIGDHRDHAYAVAAGIKFNPNATGAPEAPSAADAKPDAEPAADAKPDGTAKPDGAAKPDGESK